jgi:hypothetical protein
MTTRLINELERIRYRAGQLLAARDLQDERDFEALLRWMHTRFLHDTWGIALGLDVEPLDDSKVRIWPGLAYDGYGRELLLTQPATIGVPAVVANHTGDRDRYLVIRYRDAAEFPRKPDVVAVCLPEEMDPNQERSSVHPLRERPVFLWKRWEAVRLGEEIPLARVQSDAAGNIQLDAEGNILLDLIVRRNARPLIRPHIGYGLALVDVESVPPWIVNTENGRVQIGLQVEINTSEARFTQTPCYAAMTNVLVQLPQAQISLPVPVFESIADAQAEKFTYQGLAVLDIIGDLEGAGIPIGSSSVKISIFWIGVEPRIVTFPFAGWVVSMPPADPEDRRLGPWHIQVEGKASPWVVRVGTETVIDESEAQAKLSAWAEVEARPVMDGIWEAIHIKLYDSEE